MKKISIAILAVTLVAVCLFAGCDGAEGGKVTDNKQNLSEAMTGMQDMITSISESFTNKPDNSTNVTNATNTTDSVSVTNNVTM